MKLGEEVNLFSILSVAETEILAWYYYDGRSYEDIGRLLGIRKQSVHARVQKVLKRLAANGFPQPQRADADTRLCWQQIVRVDSAFLEVQGENEEF